MKIKQIAAVLVGAVVLGVGGSAMAGTLYNGTTTANAGAPGNYNVAIYEDSIWNFHVNSIASNGSALNVTKVDVEFFKGLNATGTPLLDGYTTEMAGTNAGVWTNWGAGHHVNIGGGGFEYFTGAANAIQGAGGNQFTQQTLAGLPGYFVLNTSNAKSFQVILETGSTGYYSEVFNITDFSTPEASSLALLLPGLVPLGIAVRRRRAARQ